MVTPESVAGATARAFAPFEAGADETDDLLVVTDFPEFFSVGLDFAVALAIGAAAFGASFCFDATTAFFVATAGLFAAATGLTGTDFAGAGFAAGFGGAAFAAALTGFGGALFTVFLAGAGFAFAATFGAGLRAAVATGRAALPCEAVFALARPAGAVLFFAIVCVHLPRLGGRVL